MTTTEMEYYVMRWCDIRRNLVVPNVHWGIGGKYNGEKYERWVRPLHECDVLSLTGSGYATEIEIKTSKADLLKDKEKGHGHVSEWIKRLYFAVPGKLKELALSEIPERAGLLVVEKNKYTGRNEVVLCRKAKAKSKALKWTDNERMQLARLGTMRIMGLKKKIIDLNKKSN